jgi:hypothetical protein
MSLIPSIYANNFASVKAAKKSFVDEYVNNHPHRLASIQPTGTVSYEFDATKLVDGSFGFKETFDINLSLLPSWTRVYEQELPVIEAGIPTNTGVFNFTHLNAYFWRCNFELGAGYEEITIGEYTATYYERPVISYDPFIEGPWEEVSSETSDITGSWFPIFGGNSGLVGGDPISGGRGADNDANCVSIETDISTNGDYVFAGMGFVPSAQILRLPWVDPWANGSNTQYSQSLEDFLIEQNDFWGAGDSWTGSTTMAVSFS